MNFFVNFGEFIDKFLKWITTFRDIEPSFFFSMEGIEFSNFPFEGTELSNFFIKRIKLSIYSIEGTK